MSSIAKLFTLPSSSRAGEERALGERNASIIGASSAEEIRAIQEATALEQEGILDEANATADAAEFNANVLRRNAVLAIDNANITEQRTRREGRRLLGSQVAAIASSGFTATGFADLIADDAREDAFDALLIRREGKISAQSFLEQAEQTTRGAREALRTGRKASRNVGKLAKLQVRGISRKSSIDQETAILTGKTRAKAAKAERTNALIDAGFSIASDIISPTSSLTRLRKVATG